MTRPRLILTGVVLIGSLLASATASASYSPRLSIKLQPPTAATAASVTSTLTSSAGDTPTRTIRIHYPPQFSFNPAFAVSGCPPAAERSDSCPPDSQIGMAGAQTVAGPFSGPVYFTPDYRILIYLRSPGDLIQDKFVGYFQDAPDGGFDAVVDNLPDFPSSSSSITIDGGNKTTLLTPEMCGSYPIVGHFTSHNGEQASSTAEVQITGCDTAPTIARLWFTRRRGATGTLHWTLSQPGARTTISLQRLQTRSGIQARRTLWSRSAGAAQGDNSATVEIQSGGERLRPGRYRIVVAVYSIDGSPSDLATLLLSVAPPRHRHPSSSCIPQGSTAGDSDADNRGGPSDGDGCT